MKGNKLTIYLAGKMSGLNFNEMNSWRVQLKSLLENCSEDVDISIRVINPCDYYNFDEPRHQSQAEIMDYDLERVRESDLVIVNLDGLDTSDGTKIEIYEAKKRCNIPVIAYNPCGQVDFTTIHPWLQCCITRIEHKMTDIKDYIRDFYMV